uniref:RAD9 checkpoint clamp component A n=1 Tax=Cairina moschata TaxID=8855 RepID=A0A8C3BW45_CAIMO
MWGPVPLAPGPPGTETRCPRPGAPAPVPPVPTLAPRSPQPPAGAAPCPGAEQPHWGQAPAGPGPGAQQRGAGNPRAGGGERGRRRPASARRGPIGRAARRSGSPPIRRAARAPPSNSVAAGPAGPAPSRAAEERGGAEGDGRRAPPPGHVRARGSRRAGAPSLIRASQSGAAGGGAEAGGRPMARRGAGAGPVAAAARGRERRGRAGGGGAGPGAAGGGARLPPAMKCVIAGSNVRAVPAGRQPLALRLRLLPPGAPLLPALPARAPRRAPALQGAHEDFPRRVPLAARAGEDGGALPAAAAAPRQPPGGAAALQVRHHPDAQPGLPGVRAAAGRLRHAALRQQPLCTGTGLLTFAEASNLPLTIHYDAPGRPAIFTLEDPLMEAHLVLATLLDPESSSQPPAANGISHAPAPSDDFADDLESYMIAMETSNYGEDLGAPPSPTFPLRTPHPIESTPQEEEEEEEEDGAVPGTPPHKKFRSLFFGSVMASGGPSPAPSQEVLAEDSDGEC